MLAEFYFAISLHVKRILVHIIGCFQYGKYTVVLKHRKTIYIELRTLNIDRRKVEFLIFIFSQFENSNVNWQ